jgi:uncharacterized membrane protein YphA (DoxX/SURF4 family)
MKYLSLIANLIVGLTYTIFGLNGFFHFIPLPEMNADSATFTGVLFSTGFLTVVKVMEIVFGLCILIGYQRPLMHVLIAPITLTIVLFELLISKQPGVGILLALLTGYMLFVYRARFLPIVAKA